MLNFQVKDMSCGHCVKAITDAILGVDAAAQVSVDLASGLVKTDARAPMDALAAAIRSAGYEPVLQAQAPKASTGCGAACGCSGGA